MTIFKVEGSKGNIYKITKEGDNYKCECKSFYYNRYTCKHIENIKQNLRNKNKTEMSQKSSKKKEMSDDAKVKFAKDSIKKLRDKILVGSTTNQNKLINFKHSDRGRGYTRIVDELPDNVFEDLGWNIYRIWSTDWWLDPKKELRKLDRYIQKLI